MSFLFVDYDQGAGGEYFCHGLSQSPECVPLNGFINNKNRTKINDIFEQEFLKIIPQPDIIDSDTDLYNLVPSHRNTNLAQSILKNVYSIRIANPLDSDLQKYFTDQQIEKVFNSPLPSGRHFIGELEMLSRTTSNNDWIKKTKSTMDNLTLVLLSKGLEPTKENREKYIQEVVSARESEPICNFDLVIPYQDLFYNTNKIKEKIRDIFSITVVGDWLEKYKKDYDAYLAKT
jgi:hypothetical protein